MGKAGRAAGRAPSLVVPTSMKRKDEGLALEVWPPAPCYEVSGGEHATRINPGFMS